MEGIENIKLCVDQVIDLTSDVQKAMADGKFQPKETLFFVDNVFQIPKTIKAAGHFWNELNDLDETEQAAIIDHVKARLKVSSAKAQEIILRSIRFAMTLTSLVNDGIALGKAIKAA